MFLSHTWVRDSWVSTLVFGCIELPSIFQNIILSFSFILTASQHPYSFVSSRHFKSIRLRVQVHHIILEVQVEQWYNHNCGSADWLWPEESPCMCSAARTTQRVVYCVNSSQQQHSYTLQGLRFFSLATEAHSACKNRMMSIWFNNIVFYVKRYHNLTSNDKFQVESGNFWH